MPFDDLIVPESFAPWAIGFGAVIGAAIGSFLNVVIYRLPRRESLIHPPSRCPHCGHAIRWRDNLPVAGWLLLGGRCRDCRSAISPRYPALEALMGLIGALLAWRFGLVPVGTPIGETGAWLLVDFHWFVFNLLFAGTLVCAAAIEFDGLVPPRRLLQVPAALGAVLLIIWPDILPAGDYVRFSGLAAALSGAAIGLLLGLAPCFALVSNTAGARGRYVLATLGELMLVGFFAGDHAIVPIALETMAVCTRQPNSRRASGRPLPALAGPGR